MSREFNKCWLTGQEKVKKAGSKSDHFRFFDGLASLPSVNW